MNMRRIAVTIVVALVAAGCADRTLDVDGEQPVSSSTTQAVDDSAPGADDDVVVGETGAEEPDGATNEDEGGVTTSSTVDRSSPRPLPSVEPVEPGSVAPVTGEVPDFVMQQVVTDAEERTGLDRASMAILRSEQVQWPDSSLGCPEPGVVYTMAIVDGYWVEIRAGDTTLDYRIDDRGFFRLCETASTTGASTPREPVLPGDDSRVPDPGDDSGDTGGDVPGA